MRLNGPRTHPPPRSLRTAGMDTLPAADDHAAITAPSRSPLVEVGTLVIGVAPTGNASVCLVDDVLLPS